MNSDWRDWVAQREKCGLLIHQIHNILEKSGNNQLKKKGLTFSQMNVLITLINVPEKKLSFKELEKRLTLAQSTTVGLISRLEQKELVAVSEDKEDKRMKFVEITALGVQYCTDAETEMEQTETELLSSLTENERDAFYLLLRKVNESIQRK